MPLWSIPTAWLDGENSRVRVSITRCVPRALLEPAQPYLPRAAINPGSLGGTVEKLTGQLEAPQWVWSTPEISLWEGWGSTGRAPNPALALWQLPGTELWAHGVPWAPLAPKTPQQDQAPLRGSSPQAEQVRGSSCPSRLRHKSIIEGKVGVLLFFCLFGCTKSNKNIPRSAERSAKRSPGGRRTPKATARPGAAPPVCTHLYLSALRRAQLCTDRCIGELQSKDSARKEI